MTNSVSSEVAIKEEKEDETGENIMEESEQENGENMFSDITLDEIKEDVNGVTHKTKLSLSFGKLKTCCKCSCRKRNSFSGSMECSRGCSQSSNLRVISTSLSLCQYNKPG